MSNPTFRILAGIIMLMGVLLAGHSAPAATTLDEFVDEQFTQFREPIRDEVEQALEDMSTGDYASALVHLNTANSLYNDALDHINAHEASGLLSATQATLLRNKGNSFQADLTKAIEIIENDLKTKQQKLTTLSKVTAEQAQGDKATQKLSPSTTLLLVGSDPGFHNPGQRVVFRILGIPPEFKNAIPCPITVQVVNAAAALGKTAVEASIQGNPCSGTIALIMGPDMGGARIIVSGFGQTRTRLLLNKGEKTTTANFAGSFSGGFSGTLTFKDNDDCGGGTQPISGGVAFTVSANGTVAVSDPASGTGKVSPTGRSATGALNVSGVSVRFTGAFVLDRDNVPLSAAGGWSANFPCGLGSGGWSAAP